MQKLPIILPFDLPDMLARQGKRGSNTGIRNCKASCHSIKALLRSGPVHRWGKGGSRRRKVSTVRARIAKQVSIRNNSPFVTTTTFKKFSATQGGGTYSPWTGFQVLSVLKRVIRLASLAVVRPKSFP